MRMSPPAMKCLPAPLTITQRTLASAASAAVCATSASIISRSSALSDAGRLSVSVAIAPSRELCSVRIHDRPGGAIESSMPTRRHRCGVRVAVCLSKRARPLEFVDRLRDILALGGGEARDRLGEVGVGDEVRGLRRHGKQSARRACAHPAPRLRSGRCHARCRTRSPGSSTPRSAGRARIPWCPSSGPTARHPSRRRARRTAARHCAMPTTMSRLPGRSRPMRSKNSSDRYGVEW